LRAFGRGSGCRASPTIVPLTGQLALFTDDEHGPTATDEPPERRGYGWETDRPGRNSGG
jgi:hypothetical protein